METVISVSAYNSKGKVSNGEWESILAETMIINDGDGIVIKDAYIDTRSRGSDDIYIEEDTTLYFNHYYYYVNAFTDSDKMRVMAQYIPSAGLGDVSDWNGFFSVPTSTTSKSFVLLPQPDGLPYMLMIFWYPYEVNTHSYPATDASGNPIAKTWQPMVGVWQYTIKAGSYAKDYLATKITKEMARVAPDKIDAGYALNVGLGDMRISETIPNTPRKNFIVQPLIRRETDDANYYSYYIDYNNLQNAQNPPSYIPSDGNDLIPAIFISVVRKEGRTNYSLQLPINYIIYPYIRLESNGFQNDLFGQGENYLIAPMVGATEISLVYNDQNNGIYSFDYLHTPLLAGGKEVVMISSLNLSTLNDDFYNPVDTAMSDRQAGIIPARLEPESFWKDILGFDTKALLGSDFIGNDFSDPQMLWADYQALTTGNYWGVSMLNDPRMGLVVMGNNMTFPSSFRDTVYRQYIYQGYIADTPALFGTMTWESETTNMVEAISPPVNPDDTGHFLIEITGYNSNFVDENDAYQIKAVVSSYYITANSFATSPFPDSFIYEHHGEPVIISSLKVRILNPKTKRVLSVGPNSTIYLQVTQQLTPEKVQQP
jgi:hypothetical protein